MTKITIKVDAIADAYGPKKAAKLLGKGIATIWRWFWDEKSLVVRIGGRTLVPSGEIERLLNEQDLPSSANRSVNPTMGTMTFRTEATGV